MDVDDETSAPRKRSRADRESKDGNPDEVETDRPASKRTRLIEQFSNLEIKEPTTCSNFVFDDVDPNVWCRIFRYLSLRDAHAFSSLSKTWQCIYRDPGFWKRRKVVFDGEFGSFRMVCQEYIMKNIQRVDVTWRPPVMNPNFKFVDPYHPANESGAPLTAFFPVNSFERLSELTLCGFLHESDVGFLAIRSATLTTLHVGISTRYQPNMYKRFHCTAGLAALTRLRDLKIDVLNGREVLDVAKCTGLTSLDLTALYNSAGTKVCRDLIPSCTNLKRLNLRTTRLDPSTLSLLVNLKSLQVKIDPIPNVVNILMEVQKCSELETLEIELENNDDEESVHLTERIWRLPDDLHFGSSLRQLYINTNMGLNVIGMEPADDVIFRATTQCPNLEKLVVLMTVSRITDEGIEFCRNTKPIACVHLKRLRIESDIKYPLSIRRITEMFPKLSSFELVDCDDALGDDGAAAISALECASCLMRLEWPDVALPNLDEWTHFLTAHKPADIRDITILGTGRVTVDENKISWFVETANMHGVHFEVGRFCIR